MTSGEFIKIAALIKTYFPRDNILPTKEAMGLWYDGVSDLDFDAVRIGLQKYAMTNRTPPSLSDLRSFAVRLPSDDPESETQAWGLVYKALGNSAYHAEEEFARLPLPIQRAVHSPGQLREWSQMDVGVVNSVIYSNFLRAYRAELTRARQDACIPEKLKLLEKMTVEAMVAGKGAGQALLENRGGGPVAQEAGPEAERLDEENTCRDEGYIADMMGSLRRKLYGNGAVREDGFSADTA